MLKVSIHQVRIHQTVGRCYVRQIPYPFTSLDVSDTPLDTTLTLTGVGQDAMTTSVQSTPVKSRWAVASDRILPALLMLGVVTAIAHWGKEDGLIYFTFVLQGAMYLEMTRVIGGDDPSSRIFAKVHKAGWFLLAALAYNAPFMTPWWTMELAMIVSTLSVGGILALIVHVQSHQRDDVFFRDVVRQAAVSCLSAVRTVNCYGLLLLRGVGYFLTIFG